MTTHGSVVRPGGVRRRARTVLAASAVMTAVTSAIVVGSVRVDHASAGGRAGAACVPVMTGLAVLGLVVAVIVACPVGADGSGHAVRALVPAVVGAELGLPLGHATAVVLLGDAGRDHGLGDYGLGLLSTTWWVDLAVTGGVLAAVTLAALVPVRRPWRERRPGA